jgi:hypothetical protein
MKIANPSLSLTIKILCLIYELNIRGQECTELQIIKHFNKTQSYILKCLNFLRDNKIIVYSTDKLKISDTIINRLDGTELKSKNIVSEAIINLQPFVEYTYFLGRGKSVLESVNLIRTIYQVEQKPEILNKIFSSWVNFVGIKPNIKPMNNSTIKKLEESIENQLKINKFLKQEFGSHFHSISQDVISDLSTAIQNINKSSKQSINDAGTAVEDCLRIDICKKHDLSKCSGIVQITNTLNKYPEEFPTKLNNIVAALGNIRSMGKAHGVDKKIKERWTITPETAISYIVLTVSLIKSYFKYQDNGKLIL